MFAASSFSGLSSAMFSFELSLFFFFSALGFSGVPKNSKHIFRKLKQKHILHFDCYDVNNSTRNYYKISSFAWNNQSHFFKFEFFTSSFVVYIFVVRFLSLYICFIIIFSGNRLLLFILFLFWGGSNFVSLWFRRGPYYFLF